MLTYADVVQLLAALAALLSASAHAAGLCTSKASKASLTSPPPARYSLYLLYWYKSTNPEAEGAGRHLLTYADVS